MSAATHRIIDVKPEPQTGPCEVCRQLACFCKTCAAAKAGRRLCARCSRAEAAKAATS